MNTNRTWWVWRLRVTVDWRSRDCLFGRFGGGWNWRLGLQAGGRTLAFHLLVATFTIRITPPKGS